jgi:hypothetical protein
MAINTKLSKVVPGFRVQVYDQGFLFECDGYAVVEGNMTTYRAVASNLTELQAQINQFLEMPKI